MPIPRIAMHSRFSHANSAPPPRAPHHKHRPPQAPTQHCNITTPAHSYSSRKPKSQTTFAHHKRQSTKPLQHHFAPTHLCTAPGRQTAARPQHRQSNPATHRQHTKAQPPGNTTPPPNDPADFWWRKRSRQTHAPEQKKVTFLFSDPGQLDRAGI